MSLSDFFSYEIISRIILVLKRAKKIQSGNTDSKLGIDRPATTNGRIVSDSQILYTQVSCFNLCFSPKGKFAGFFQIYIHMSCGYFTPKYLHLSSFIFNLTYFVFVIFNLQVEDREDIKKEREIIQMVRDLDLSGDELERIEVPRGMYDPSTGGSPSSNHNNTSSSHHHNGHNGHPSTNSGVLHRPMSHMQIPTAVMTNGRAHRR